MGPTFKKGDQVEVKAGRWRLGKITGSNGDGTYGIRVEYKNGGVGNLKKTAQYIRTPQTPLQAANVPSISAMSAKISTNIRAEKRKQEEEVARNRREAEEKRKQEEEVAR